MSSSMIMRVRNLLISMVPLTPYQRARSRNGEGSSRRGLRRARSVILVTPYRT